MPTLTLKFTVSQTTGATRYRVTASQGKYCYASTQGATTEGAERAAVAKMVCKMGWSEMDISWHRGVLPSGDVVYVSGQGHGLHVKGDTLV